MKRTLGTRKHFFILTLALALAFAMALTGCGSTDTEMGGTERENETAAAGGIAAIAAIYSAPQSQIVTDADGSKSTADTFIYLYQNGTYRQYIDHEGTLEIYSEGTCELNGELEAGKPVIVTLHVDRLHQEGHELQGVDLSYDVNLSNHMNYCLYPVGDNAGKEIVAAFMQTDKQRLVKKDGTETELTTMWFYYDDGTFQQYALLEDGEDILFSTGDYSFSEGGFAGKGSVMTLHRTQKYEDGEGLAAYDSTHDYTIGELGFLRIYPEAEG